MPQFSHLHVHTQYSLLDGASSIRSLYKKAQKDNMPALAISDHGNMFGVFDFVNEAWKNTKIIGKDDNGKDITTPVVKPIVGCELYVVADRHIKTFTREKKDTRYHQILLVKNATGYQNLLKIVSLGFIEGLYSKYPRVDKALIEQYHEGLIATTCCLGAYVPQMILQHGEERAEQEFLWWKNLFGDDYYVEIQRHDIPEQIKINEVLLRFAKKYNVPIIASNDSHYTEQDDYNAHDILLCINTGEKQTTPGYDDIINDDLNIKNRRFKFPNNNFYFKNTTEMMALFSDIPQALDNTNAIIDKVEVLNLKKDILLPSFPVPEAFKKNTNSELNQYEYLHHLTALGAKERYQNITPEIQERIDFELFTIKTMGFAGYFLIVSDFIKAGRDIGVFVGPGRGSAAGSVVAYCIGITNIDPIKYNLLFERFLNPDRKSMPDIDTDFDDEGRQKVINYVVEKYGKNQVAQIITYGTMAAKGSIKDVARVMDLPLQDASQLVKLVPDKPGTSLWRVLHAPLTNSVARGNEESLEAKEGLQGDNIENIKRLRKIYEGNDIQASVLREAEKLEGNIRNIGTHAAGIIIAPKDLTELMPVATNKDSSLWITQIDGSVIEDAGVIKMDFLGLSTLSILKTALDIIRQNHDGKEIDLDSLPLDDAKTFQLYQRGETNATFQFESPGMQKYLRELKPDKFGDLIAMNALYRPGPMAYIPNYIARKQGREKVRYDIDAMKEYLEETYGITVYQEQVMLLSQKLAGFSKGDADILRKAMGKKQKAVLDKMKAKFIEGATKNNYDRTVLEKVWTDWESFAQYAFNKSHATCYALIAYQTAYLKAHYPSEYMAAVLNHAKNIDKIMFFMEECKRMGLTVLVPDINESEKGFTVNKKENIRFGFGGIKGVGDAAIENIIAERATAPFKNIFDLVTRCNLKAVNKKSLESLVCSGAFDSFLDLHRAQYFNISNGEKQTGLEKIIAYGQSVNTRSIANATASLFGETTAASYTTPNIAPCEEWDLLVRLQNEKEVTGMFLSGHPLSIFRFEMAHYNILSLSDFNEIKETSEQTKAQANRSIRIAGFVVNVIARTTRKGKTYNIVTIEDFVGNTELTLWDDDFLKYKHLMEKGQSIVVVGNFEERRYQPEQYEFRIQSVTLMATMQETFTKSLAICLHPNEITEGVIELLENIVHKNPGKTVLKLYLHDPTISYNLGLFREKGFSMNSEMVDFLVNNPSFEVKIA